MVIHNFPDIVMLNEEDAACWTVRNVGGRPMSFPLWENEQGLVYNGKPVKPRIHYIYIHDDSVKKIPAAGCFLCRSMFQAPQWHVCGCMGLMELSEKGQWYETISLLPDADASMECPLVWHRYLVTDDPNAEKPGDCAVRLNRLSSECEVAGMDGYCEKIYIPAFVNGTPVERVDLRKGSRSQYLREFVVEKGVPLIRMDFDIESLEKIEIPEDSALSEPPNGILNTAWFRRQEGDVYFHGYYCGTRGCVSDPILTLKEGTVGILAGARAGEGRTGVILPDSLCYVGPNALRDVCGFRQQQIFPHTSKEKEASGISGKTVTAANLYQLGRCGFAAGCLVAEGYEPVAPRLTYDNGWIAHYYYTNEFSSHIQYYLAVHLATGLPYSFEKLDSAAYTRPVCWRRDKPTAHFNWAKDYLIRSAALIRMGSHDEETLAELEARWRAILPENLKDDIFSLMRSKELTAVYDWGKKGNRYQ